MHKLLGRKKAVEILQFGLVERQNIRSNNPPPPPRPSHLRVSLFPEADRYHKYPVVKELVYCCTLQIVEITLITSTDDFSHLVVSGQEARHLDCCYRFPPDVCVDTKLGNIWYMPRRHSLCRNVAKNHHADVSNSFGH